MSPRNGPNPAATDLPPAGHDPCPDSQPCAHAQRARQQTILQVRHELRTPLAALRSFLELATEDDLEPAVVHECLEAIDRNVLRLSEALDRISVGDIEAGPEVYRVSPSLISVDPTAPETAPRKAEPSTRNPEPAVRHGEPAARKAEPAARKSDPALVKRSEAGCIGD